MRTRVRFSVLAASLRRFGWLVCLLCGGCALAPAGGSGPLLGAEDLNAETLLAGAPLTGAIAADVAADTVTTLPGHYELLALDDDMRAFLRRYVDEKAPAQQRLQQLLHTLIESGTFTLRYEQVTRTASETFHQRDGNCLSFTNLFIAMARELDIDARFQEVDVPPEWDRQGDTFVLNRHINVYVELGLRRQVVDFNIENFRASYEHRLVDDRRAAAHYYSNIAVERMQVGRQLDALQAFRAGVEADEDFAPLWTNLGTLYLRGRHYDYAEAAYRRALRIDPFDYVAMNNLARLYAATGNEKEAKQYRERARHHREQNPYYRYQLARDAFFARDYATAQDHLRFAIKKKPEEDSFYFLLGTVYLQQGDEKRARRFLEKAEALAQDDRLKSQYSSKMKLLLSQPESVAE